MDKKTTEYQYLFGPVPSRRLGLSLGVDLLPYKTCTLDCVYCESGQTTELTLERKPYISVQSVIDELSSYLSTTPKLDYITFSGNGEPTLHSGIGEIIDFIRTRYPEYKIALLTNSTLFNRDDVRNDVSGVDLVVASVDAVSDQAFSKINRPDSTLSMPEIIEGLCLFREMFNNELWVEVFIVPGVNDEDFELDLVNSALKRIKPDKIQINSLDRPGTEDWVEPVDNECLGKMIQRLTAAEVINKAEIEKVASELSININQRITELVKRRPCTIDDISLSLGIAVDKASENLKKLVKAGMVFEEKMERGIFFKLKK